MSTMTPDEVAAALERLGLDDESKDALRAVPLAYVAWADGDVQPSEHLLIRKIASERGWLKGYGDATLATWLTTRLPPARFDDAMRLLRHFATKEQLREVLSACRDVAREAGGVFGIGAISGEEAGALAALVRRISDEDERRSWKQILAEASS